MTADEKSLFISMLEQKNYEQFSSFSVDVDKIAGSFPAEDSYFLGLQYRAAGIEHKAEFFFEYGIKNANVFFKRLCIEQLASEGSKSQKLSYAKQYVKLFPEDVKARLFLVRVLYEEEKYNDVLSVFQFPDLEDFKSTPSKEKENLKYYNELCFYGICSLIKIGSYEKASSYLSVWAKEWPSNIFFEEFLSSWEKTSDEIRQKANFDENIIELLKFRISIMKKYWKQGFSISEKLPFSIFSETPVLLSEIGKTYLYGGISTSDALSRFKGLVNTSRNNEIRFLIWFYSARFYSILKDYQNALAAFEEAMSFAPNPENYDNALWYYFETARNVSVPSVLQAVKRYASTWYDSVYFWDFFYKLSTDLLNDRRWNDFVSIYRQILPFADSNTIAQYSYISARLIQEKLARNPFPDQSDEQVVKDAFNKAYSSSGRSLYYRLLAANQLGVPLESADKLGRRYDDITFESDKNYEKLINGYSLYGFPEKVCSEYIAAYTKISLECAVTLAERLSAYAEQNPKYHYDALRIMAFATRNPDTRLSRDVLQLLYPRPYLDAVTNAASRFDADEYIMYGLIRTESYFNKDAFSSAGAKGLAQLMTDTADEVAKKLKIENYDIFDAETNVLLGTYYINNLIFRLDDSPMLALFAYNAGPTRVRRWLKNSKDLPIDLFLETVPFEETRDYGRQVLSAAAIYGYLYYDKSPHQVVQEIMLK